MAKIVVVAVFDSAVNAFGRPIFVPSIGVALRSFGDEVNRKAEDNQMFQHPEDFVLHYLCDFDEESGVFVTEEPRRVLARAKDVDREGVPF